MSTRRPAAGNDTRGETNRRIEESNWLLDAIAGAIVSGKLPPDDACAWAKIAACEVRRP